MAIESVMTQLITYACIKSVAVTYLVSLSQFRYKTIPVPVFLTPGFSELTLQENAKDAKTPAGFYLLFEI